MAASSPSPSRLRRTRRSRSRCPARRTPAARRWPGSTGLARERRLAPKTLAAYGRDLRQFLTFLAVHLGGAPTARDLVGLKPLDIRAFLAARRAEGVQSRSLMRQLAALRSFARHLEREGHGVPSAFAAIRSPKLARTLPRPLAPASALAMTDPALREGREPWILARDAAVLGLLYGAGLRISEALGISRQDAPVGGIDSVTVVGKGGKTRTVPVIAPVRRAIEDYLKLCPYSLAAQGPLFVGGQGRAALAAHHPVRGGGAARGAGPPRLGDPARASATPCHASPGARRRSARHPGAFGHASLSSTQLYTRVDAARLLSAFDAAHPRAGRDGRREERHRRAAARRRRRPAG
jgi:integrase/recombinase XerC